MKWIGLAYLAASLLTFGLYGLDKHRARRSGRRVPERVLHLWELLGGWPGAWIAQRFFHHKSRKRSFRLVYWAVVGLHLAGWGLWWFRGELPG